MNFADISDRALVIVQKVEAGTATNRDIAELAELYQQAIDRMDELIDNLPAEKPLLARLDGQITIKFNNDADDFARWVAGIME